MGNRLLIQVTDGKSVSPVLYLHWGADNAPTIFAALKQRMKPRGADVDYTFARLVQIACNINSPEDCLSVGVWNQTTKLNVKDSHGDGGILFVTWGADGEMVFEVLPKSGHWTQAELDAAIQVENDTTD